MGTKQTNEFDGVWTALITPFTDTGEIDWPAYEALIERQIAGGVTGVVVSGTTGEAPTLAVQEKLALIRKTKALIGNRIRLMAGTGGNNTSQSLELSKLAEDAGADSLLIVTPPYNKPSTAGLALHYETIGKGVNIPLCLYHVPGRTAQMLTVDQLSYLCEIDSIKCVKEASADIGFFSRSLNRSAAVYLSGDDPTYLASLAVGGRGVISVVSNIFPAEMVALGEAFQKGDHSRARELHSVLLPLIDILFCEPNPAPTKVAFEHLGWSGEFVRAPLAKMVESNRQLVIDTLDATRKKLELLG
jgi:4-hydroxy-tetrahydrodipicolinate synthase